MLAALNGCSAASNRVSDALAGLFLWPVPVATIVLTRPRGGFGLSPTGKSVLVVVRTSIRMILLVLPAGCTS
jgi:hypothetical protein